MGGHTPGGIIIIDAITKISYICIPTKGKYEGQGLSGSLDSFASVDNSVACLGSQQAGCCHLNYNKNLCCRFAVDAAMLDWQDNFSGLNSGTGRLLPPLLPFKYSALRELGIEMERIFAPPLQRGVVDMNEAKPSAVAERPLEIIEQ